MRRSGAVWWKAGLKLVAAAVLITVCSGNRAFPRPEMSGKSIALTFPRYAARAVRVQRDRMLIDDGDTFVYDGITVRILGIDTPEIRHPEHGFFEDQEYGREAAAKAVEIFDAADVIEYVADSLDPYGRTLGQVFVDGQSYAVMMIEAHLAYESVSHFGDNGFPDIAELILAAAKKAGTPPFEDPYIWRGEHRKEPAPAAN